MGAPKARPISGLNIVGDLAIKTLVANVGSTANVLIGVWDTEKYDRPYATKGATIHELRSLAAAIGLSVPRTADKVEAVRILFGFFGVGLGVSSPTPQPQPEPTPAPTPEPTPTPQGKFSSLSEAVKRTSAELVSKVDGAHAQLLSVVAALVAGRMVGQPVYPWLYGKAGSGKTHMAGAIAQAFGLQFYAASMSPSTMKSELYGFIGATNIYQIPDFRKAWEFGGVILLDEFCNAHPTLPTSLNMALSADVLGFPDGMVKRHPDFICLVADNTRGRGSENGYIRQALDQSTLDRFVQFDIVLDPKVEERMVTKVLGDDPMGRILLSTIRKCRSNAERYGLGVDITPRSTQQGVALLLAGMSLRQTVEACVLKGMGVDNAAKVTEGVAF